MSFQHVKIYYGPCESFHTLGHKPQKLSGLKDHLQKLGYRVDLNPVDFEDYCILEMCGHEVFRCNINNLRFNTPYLYDPVVQRAVAAVEESSEKFKRARCYLWLWTLLEENMFRNDLGPKDFWPERKHKPHDDMTTYDVCIKCCDILHTNKDTPMISYLPEKRINY